jgi:hypothetical protein
MQSLIGLVTKEQSDKFQKYQKCSLIQKISKSCSQDSFSQLLKLSLVEHVMELPGSLQLFSQFS